MTEVFSTQRLWVRRLDADCLSDLMTLFSDPQAIRDFAMAGRPAPDPREVLRRTLHDYGAYGHGFYGLHLKENGVMIGLVGLLRQRIEARDDVEVGYRLHPEYWGQGYALEAAVAARNHAFETLAVDRVISLILPENLASRRVAERSGMRFAGRRHWSEKDLEIDLFVFPRPT
ncbi:MAG: GNAT family N-acetyltransferase [Myxococcota bacterium]